MTERYCLTTSESGEAGWELIRAWYSCPVYEYGDHPHAAFQCCFNLQTYEVARVIQAPPPVFIGGFEPAVADYR